MAEMAPFLAAPSPPPSPMGPHHGGGGPWSPSASIAGGGGGGRPPILPTNINALYRQPRPPPPGGVFFYRSPSGIAAAAAAAATRMGGSGLPLIPSLPMHPAIMPALDTVLRFALLSEVVVKSQDQGLVMSDISHLCTFADHFYVSFNSQIYAYKILFGGNRTYQESAVLVENQIFPKKVTCLHCSRPQPPLLIIGTENGGIFSWDPRKGPRAHMAVIRQPEETGAAISTLIHFMASINAAQVVVAGDKAGTLSWYISQPPQKTYSLLFSDSTHSPHPIITLQVLGGVLISGSKDGAVNLWSMRSHEPMKDSFIRPHTSLLNIHILDNSHFYTIGSRPLNKSNVADNNSNNNTNGRGSPGEEGGSKEEEGGEGQESSSSETPSNPPPPPSVNMVPVVPATGQQPLENLASEMGELSVEEDREGGESSDQLASSAEGSGGSSGTIVGGGSPKTERQQYSVTLWEYNKPPRILRTMDTEGEVMSTSFHHQLNFGNMFLAVGLRDGRVKIHNVPSLVVASELHFPDMKGKDCVHIALNLSRDPLPMMNHRNPFRDLLLTTVWSDGKALVCQVAKQPS